jgi:hypothetical protein
LEEVFDVLHEESENIRAQALDGIAGTLQVSGNA